MERKACRAFLMPALSWRHGRLCSRSPAGAQGRARRLLLDVPGPLPDLPGAGHGRGQLRIRWVTRIGSCLK